MGGITGLADRTYIASCISTAAVTGSTYVGGLAGYLYSYSGIADCAARGNVAGTTTVGGFIGGTSLCTVMNCYSTGAVSGTTNAGGFSGLTDNDKISGCIWDTTTSGKTTSAAGADYATAAMQCSSTFINAGWDFADESANGRIDTWSIPTGGGYPVLWYELATPPALPAFAGGVGTVSNPYLIETVDQLNSIGNNPRLLDKNFKLNSDLNMAGVPFTMIASNPYVFSGSFDGAGYSIYNLQVKPVFDLCAVGFIGCGETTANLKLKNTYVVKGWDFANVWTMCEGSSYSRHLWAKAAADLVCPEGVNMADFAMLASEWLKTDCATRNYCNGTDLDQSGAVNTMDLFELAANWMDGGI